MIQMKKVFKSLLIMIAIYFGAIVLEYARQGFINDVSLEPVDVEQNKAIKESVYLISYADGAEYIFKNQNATNHYSINKGIDFTLNYKRKHIDPDFIAKNQEIFDTKLGVGLWLWKPYIIYETMKNAPENSYILYLDSNFKMKTHISEFISLMGDKDIMLVRDRETKNGQSIKGDAFMLANCMTEECRNDHHVWAAILMIKNTKQAREFIKSWLDLCQDIRILSPESYGLAPNYPEYNWHFPEQGLLSITYHKNKNIVKLLNHEETLPMLAWFHRKSTPSSPNKVWYTVYGADPVVNFQNNGKALPSTGLLNTPPIVHMRKWWILAKPL